MSQLELTTSELTNSNENWFTGDQGASAGRSLAAAAQAHRPDVSCYTSFQPLSPSAELKRRVFEELQRTKFLVLRRISVEVEDEIVTLVGRVNTFHERQLAVHRAWQTPGVFLVIDRLIVRDWPQGHRQPR